MSCCTTILDLGCYTSCDLIDTGIAADAVNYRIEWEWLGVTNRVTVAGVSGADLTVPAFIFNERSSPIFKVWNLSTEAFISVSGSDCLTTRITPLNSGTLNYDPSDALTYSIQVDELTGTGFVTATSTVIQLIGVWRNGQLRNENTYTLVGNVVTFIVTATSPALDPTDSVTLIYLTS